MIAPLGRWLVVIALVLLIGGHWAFLQVCAWTGMLVSYSRSETFSSAVKMTFDGEHPCRLCKVVQAGQAADHEQPVRIQGETKLEFFLNAPPSLDVVPRPAREDTGFSAGHPSRRDPPLLRPPISA